VTGYTIKQWVAIMYAVCLDYPDLVDQHMQQYCVTGPFRMPGRFWFYSGAFFWVRNHRLANRDWRRVHAGWGCVEQWPRNQFKYTECGCLFHERHCNLYDANVMTGVRREFRSWCRANRKHRIGGEHANHNTSHSGQS